MCMSKFWCEITSRISFLVNCLISRATLGMDFFVLNHARDHRRKPYWPRADRQCNFKIIFHLFSSFVYAKPKQHKCKFKTFGGAVFIVKSRCLQSCDAMQFTWNKLKFLDLRSRKSSAKFPNEGYDVREKRAICCINKVCINKPLY